MNNLIKEAIKSEGIVSIVSWANNDAHIVNTWNSYLVIDGDKIYIPAFGFRKTEENVKINPNVKVTLGSKEVQGLMSMGTGFLIEGTAKFLTEGSVVDSMKEKFNWSNRVLEITVVTDKQTV